VCKTLTVRGYMGDNGYIHVCTTVPTSLGRTQEPVLVEATNGANIINLN